MALLAALRASLVIRRPEFLIAELPIVALPLALAAAPGTAGGVAFWAGIAAIVLLFHLGDLANCLADRELDAVHKPHLAAAVRRLGVRNVAVQIALSGLGAVILAAVAGWRLDRWWLPAMAVAGLVAGLAYSLPPLRLKGRAAWQVPCLWTIIFTGPMVFAACLVRDWPAPATLAACAAYATAQIGVILVNTAEDLPEDRAAGLRTVVVALGLRRALRLALVLVMIGGAGLVAALAAHASGAQAAWAALALPAPLAATVDLARLAGAVARAGDETAAVAAVRRAARRVPLWLTAVAWLSLAAALLLRPPA